MLTSLMQSVEEGAKGILGGALPMRGKHGILFSPCFKKSVVRLVIVGQGLGMSSSAHDFCVLVLKTRFDNIRNSESQTFAHAMSR